MRTFASSIVGGRVLRGAAVLAGAALAVVGCGSNTGPGAGPPPTTGGLSTSRTTSIPPTSLPTITMTTGHPTQTRSVSDPPATSQSTSSPPTSSPPTSSSTAAPSSGLRSETLARFAGFGDELVAAGGAAYVEWQVPHQGAPTDWRISRYDVADHRVSAVSELLHGAGQLAIVGDSLWVATDPRNDRAALVKLDATSLHVKDVVPLRVPIVGGGLVATPAGLWIGGAGKLLLVDPSRDQVARTLPVTGVAGQLAVDARAGVLYDVTHRLGERTAIAVEERDAATGRLLARSSSIAGYLAINGLAVVPDNVWVAYPTGTLGTATRFTRAGLVAHHPAEGQAEGSNGIDVFSTPAMLWVDSGAGGVACVDPSTGTTRAALAERPIALGQVAATGSEVFRVIGPRLERLIPGDTCPG